MWKSLAHPNIVPLIGATIESLQLISDWMPNGNLTDYIKRCSGVDRLSLVGFSLLHQITHLIPRQLHDVSKAVYHLHSVNIIHGDLKGVSEFRKASPQPAAQFIQHTR